ncbi:uncharacterized protein [Dasypus novemcinctus]|uniref:uncharacterized protein n=1 Tax=Dasypus novemcinctus TaxID=9361 RepID=UPI0039C90AA2
MAPRTFRKEEKKERERERGAGLARDSWSNPEKPIRRSPSTSPQPAGLAQTPAGRGQADGGGRRGPGSGPTCARARGRACVRGPGLCVSAYVCVCVCARGRERVCACLCAWPLGALGNRLQDKCCPAAPRRAHSLAPGRVAPRPETPRTRAPPPKGDQVTASASAAVIPSICSQVIINLTFAASLEGLERIWNNRLTFSCRPGLALYRKKQGSQKWNSDFKENIKSSSYVRHIDTFQLCLPEFIDSLGSLHLAFKSQMGPARVLRQHLYLPLKLPSPLDLLDHMTQVVVELAQQPGPVTRPPLVPVFNQN